MLAALLVAGLADEWLGFFPAGALDDLAMLPGRGLATAALLVSLVGLGGLVGGILAVAADHVSRRVLASAGAFAFGVCLISFALPLPLWLAATGAFGLGVGSDAMVHGCDVALVDVAGDRLPTFLARSNLLAFAGDLLGPLTLALFVAVGLGWQTAFVAGGVVAMAYAGVLAGHPLPPPSDPQPASRAARDTLLVARDRRVWVLAGLGLVVSILDEPLLGFAIARWREEGVAPATAIVLATGWVVGGLLGTAVLSLRPDTGGRLSGGAVLLAAGVTGMAVLPWWGSALAGGLAGWGTALVWTHLEDRVLRLLPGRAGTTSAVVGYVTLPGYGFALLAGAVAESIGLGAALGAYAVVAMVGIGAAAGVDRLSAGRGR